MTLAEQITSDFVNAVSNTDEFAQVATYKKYEDGSELQVSVIIEDVNLRDQYSEGRLVSDNANIFVYLEFKPSIYDSITIDTDTWVIDSFSGINNRYKLDVSKDRVSTRKHTQGRFR